MDSNTRRLVNAIRDGDDLTINQLYEDCFHYAANFVLTNSGTMEDARECFQEAFCALYRSTLKTDFEINTEVKFYLAGSVKNIWLKELKRKKRKNELVNNPNLQKSNTLGLDNFDDILVEKLVLEESFEKLDSAFILLGSECKKILNYTFLHKKRDKEIAPLMNYTIDFVRQKRRRCLSKLKDIANDL